MKILFTSDLHIIKRTMNEQLDIVRKKIKIERPDVFVVSGDVCDETLIHSNDVLENLGCEVVYCLGNHEFVCNEFWMDNSVVGTLSHYKSCKRESSAHCLDVDGHFDIGGVRFVGNVLWYDGSLTQREDAELLVKNISPTWLDSRIISFNALAEHKKCVAQIKRHLRSTANRKVVLVTHCVPHQKLNWFSENQPLSIYNAYSGVDNLFDKQSIYPDVALCGHTHKAIKYLHKCANGKETMCINVGNDYFWNNNGITFEVIEI